MYEYYDLEIEKEDFEKVVKYFLTSDKMSFYQDLAERDKLGYYGSISFDFVKSLVLGKYEDFDYCLLDDIKYYASQFNEDLKNWYKAVENDKAHKDDYSFLVDLFNDLDRNERNCLTRAWCKADKYFKGV